MKVKLLLMLLVCGACFSCNAPQHDTQDVDSTKVNKNMTNEQLREKLVMVLDMKILFRTFFAFVQKENV